MFDWSGLVGNALWICGLAVCLAALSMAYYETRAGQERLCSRLRRPELQLALAAGMSLFCLGLLLSSGTWWEKGIWGVCAILLTGWAVRAWRRRGATRDEGA
jgi:F0F1-type ATP synthase membrane subunit c/vacuolar-type H+-ATPase subunit K